MNSAIHGIIPPSLLLHGLVSTPNEFSMLRQSLERQGAEVYTPEIEGYSFRPGLRAKPWQSWLESAREELVTLSDRHGRVVVGGLCIGAVLALALAINEPDRVAGLTLMSPTLFYDGWGLSRWLKMRHLGYHVPFAKRMIDISEREPFGVKNPQIRKWIVREMQKQAVSSAGAAKLPLWAIHEAEKMMRHVRSSLHKIETRILVMHAREDEVASLKTPHYIVEHVSSADRKLVVLENSYHMITLDNDRHQVANEMAAFLIRANIARREFAPMAAASPTSGLFTPNLSTPQCLTL